jgi:WD40-like Beta Propeller Repeat
MRQLAVRLSRVLFVLLAGRASLSAGPLIAREEGETSSRVLARMDAVPVHLRVNNKGNLMAFTPEGALGLRVLDMKSGHIFEATGFFVGPAFFWSPDGARLFYREIRIEDGQTTSRLRAWDVTQGKNLELESFSGSSGFPTFDPRDNRWMVLYDKGVKTKKLLFPGNRLAAWQSAQRRDLGKWVMAQKGAAFVTESGFKLRTLEDDASGVESFDISPDGSTAVWSTTEGRIFTSKDGEKPRFMDWGRDPRWHPERMLVVYAGGRMVGNKASDYDIKIAAPGSKGSFLTATQHSPERWPNWSRDGKNIIYVREDAREIREMPFHRSVYEVAMPSTVEPEAVRR